MPIFASALTFSGTIQKKDGSAFASPNAQFSLELVYGACVLYAESQTSALVTPSGAFNIDVGEGSATYNGNGKNVFAQKEYNCQDGSKATPTFVELKATAVVDGETVDAGTYTVPKIAKSYQADQISGLGVDQLIQVKDSVTQTAVKSLVDLIPQLLSTVNGSNNLYAKMSDIPVGSNLNTRLEKTENLADLPDSAVARGNLGLGSMATEDSATYTRKDQNLGDLTDASQARVNLGLGSAATEDKSVFPRKDQNLSDLGSASVARTNLGLGSMALLNKSDIACQSNESVGFNSITDSLFCQEVSIPYSKITGVPTNFAPSAHTHTASEITDLGPLATVANLVIGDLPSSIPDSKLSTISTAGKVNGSAITTGSIQTNADIVPGYLLTTSATIDMSNGNSVRYTPSGACGAIHLTNVKMFGQYTVVVRSNAAAGTCTFTAAGAPLSGIGTLTGTAVKYQPANTAVTANTDTIYSIITSDDRMYILFTPNF